VHWHAKDGDANDESSSSREFGTRQESRERLPESPQKAADDAGEQSGRTGVSRAPARDRDGGQAGGRAGLTKVTGEA
jgi:hypothetical protein